MAQAWKKSDWRTKPRVQMPDYLDGDSLNAVEAQLSKYPPLVFAGEARRLKDKLSMASMGKAFLLQGGIVPKVSPNLTQITFVTLSALCCKWLWF